MRSTETIFVIGILVLFSIFALNLNKSMLNDSETVYDSEEMLEAIAFAQKYIEEAEMLRFDEDGSAMTTANFTLSSSLGPETGEVYPQYDDIDDFNNFSYTDTSYTTPLRADIDVHYVSNTTNFPATSSRTYIKQIVVSITPTSGPGTQQSILEMKKIFAYHYFFVD